MIVKFKDWNDITQDYIKESLAHVVNRDGYVVNIHTHNRTEEDYVYDAIEMVKQYPLVTRKTAIDMLEKIDGLKSEQSYVVGHIIHYLKNNFQHNRL